MRIGAETSLSVTLENTGSGDEPGSGQEYSVLLVQLVERGKSERL